MRGRAPGRTGELLPSPRGWVELGEGGFEFECLAYTQAVALVESSNQLLVCLGSLKGFICFSGARGMGNATYWW